MSAYGDLLQFLDQHNLKYREVPEHKTALAGFCGHNGNFDLAIKVDDDNLVAVYGPLPVKVLAGCRPAVSKLIARANYGMRVGKFELDVDEGRLLFHASSVYCDDSLPDELLTRLIGVSLSMLDRYFPAIMAVIYGNEVVESAIAGVEKS